MNIRMFSSFFLSLFLMHTFTTNLFADCSSEHLQTCDPASNSKSLIKVGSGKVKPKKKKGRLKLSQGPFSPPVVQPKPQPAAPPNPHPIIPTQAPDIPSATPHPVEEKMNPQWYLGIAAVFQDEELFLKEWIEYHMIIGVQHFYLYNNGSTDNYHKVLDPYIRKGIVELFDCEKLAGNNRIISALGDAIHRANSKCNWLALIEIDEYIMPVDSDNMRDFLSDYEGFAGVIVNWQIYGTSWVSKLPEGMLMTQYLTLKFPELHNENRHVRSIVQPQFVEVCTCPHRCLYKPGYFAVDSNKVPHWGGYGGLNPSIPINEIRINKYMYGPEDTFFGLKLPKKEAKLGHSIDRNWLYKLIELSNSEYDPCMLRFTIELRKRMNYTAWR